MNWFDWVLVAWWSVSLLLMINGIGKPRKPISNGEALLGAIIVGGLITGLVLTR